MIPSANHRRRGMTLVEILAAISASAILLTLAVMLLALLMRESDRVEDHRVEQTALGRLADHFRGDVWSAIEVHKVSPAAESPDSEAIECRFRDGRTVEYRLEHNRVVRREKAEGIDRAQETFAVGEAATVRFRLPDDEASPIATLILDESLLPGTGSKRHRLAIEAVVGRDHRWATLTEPSAEESRKIE